MELRKRKILFLMSILLLGTFLIFNLNSVSAAESTVCAERTLEGVWCQNVPLSEADTSYRTLQTSCESTSFCKRGTCIDSDQGTCQPGTPQNRCNDNGGIWNDNDPEDIPQCQLGCCILGDTASFVSQSRCSTLSSDFGLETDYRADIRDEDQCIASAFPKEVGACVYEEDFQKTCRMIPRSECQEIGARLGTEEGSGSVFNGGLLCSAEILATNCGRSEKTTCVENRDEVRFLDTCGNLANIYDSSKVDDQEYWTNIKKRDESCNPESGNINSPTCGSCNYFLGSTCKAFERGETAEPVVGDNICKDLGCKWEGVDASHGEAWCQSSSETSEGDNLPGSEYFRLVCSNNEVTIEPCASFRNEVCVEDQAETANGDFNFASCKINIWGGCYFIDNEDDCSDVENHDCQWVGGQTNSYFVVRDENSENVGKKYVLDNEGYLVDPSEFGDDADGRQQASCVPKYAPGFDFWSEEVTEEKLAAEQWCKFADDAVVLKFKQDLGDIISGKWDCVENCEYLSDPEGKWEENDNTKELIGIGLDRGWQNSRNALCTSLGDCGASVNYKGVEGEYDEEKIIELKPISSDGGSG